MQLEQEAAALIARAQAEGKVVTITLAPHWPPAMGAYSMVSDVRLARAAAPASQGTEGQAAGAAFSEAWDNEPQGMREEAIARYYFDAGAALAQPAVKEAVVISRETLIDLIEERLGCFYFCGRVWAAWRVGTMSERDFTEARETDLAPDIADAVISKIAAIDAARKSGEPKEGKTS